MESFGTVTLLAISGTETKYHKYYQWVCFFLFFEAALFYTPRYIWKNSEGGKIKMLVQGKTRR